MSIEIPESYVLQFSGRVHNLAEQKFSRFRPFVMVEAVTGESFSRERIGGSGDTPNQIVNLHGDTPLDNHAHTRRWGYIKDFDTADLIDKVSKVKLLIDPESIYAMKHAGKMGRGIDDECISALGGSAQQGKNGTTAVPLPAGQKIAAGAVGLTVAKLMEAKERLDRAEVDEFIPRYVGATAKQIRNLLEDDKVASSDYNTVKALVRGEIDTYLGFRFLRSERFLKPAADRLIYAWAHDAIVLGMQQEPTSVAAVRPDKRMAQQIYTYGSWGAMRIEDERVIEIACTE